MGTTEQYDCVVIGAGQAGTPLSRSLARAGLRTALIEAEHLGGTCVNEGCTPTKTMVASARVAYLAGRAADYGVHTDPVRIDMSRVRERKRAIVASFRAGLQNRVEQTANLTLICGGARFTGPKSVRVESGAAAPRTVTGSRVFINAGTRPAHPQIQGLDAISYLDNASIMELDSVPGHLLVPLRHGLSALADPPPAGLVKYVILYP